LQNTFQVGIAESSSEYNESSDEQLTNAPVRIDAQKMMNTISNPKSLQQEFNVGSAHTSRTPCQKLVSRESRNDNAGVKEGR
jgi:hypothetical protein